MIIKGSVKKGAYSDSVSLMAAAKRVCAMPGVLDAALVMGTRENKSILQSSGMMLPVLEGASDADLVVSIKAESAAVADAVIRDIEKHLKDSPAKPGSGSARSSVRSLDGALKVMPDANLALISVAGRYAGAEARSALERGLNVMIFSDNVTVEEEIVLKQEAASKGLFVMGPDCGTALINGVPLGFANAVRRGPIGIVAASGTGLQEVSCICSNLGQGISQAIGTGGRDVKKEVGGIMFVGGIRALAADPDTRVLLLVSKPPHKDVLQKISLAVKEAKKPVVSVFLGSKEVMPGVFAARTLEEAAHAAAAIAAGTNAAAPNAALVARMKTDKDLVKKLALALDGKKNRRFLRALYSGGTFASEALVMMRDAADVFAPGSVHANIALEPFNKLEDSWKSREHTVIDLGEDEFTVGRPHPMIDYTLRNRKIIEEAASPETAFLLLDVVLGYGSHPDPAAEITPAIREACRSVPVICAVTGTDADPQGRARTIMELRAAGAVVTESNAHACSLAIELIRTIENVQ